MLHTLLLIALICFSGTAVHALGGGGSHGDGRWAYTLPSTPPTPTYTYTSVYNFSADRMWMSDYQGATSDCWAAADANILAWTGWASPGLSSQDVFNRFYSAYGSTPNTPYQGMIWYFNNEIPGVNASVLPRYYTYGQSWSAPAIERAINERHGVVLSLRNMQANEGHAVSVWGYQTRSDGTFTGVYVTNSQQMGSGLELWPVSADGTLQWNGYDFWYFDTLDIKPPAFDPKLAMQTAQSSFPSEYYAQPTGQPLRVPEPLTVVLLVTGSILRILLTRSRRWTGPLPWRESNW